MRYRDGSFRGDTALSVWFPSGLSSTASCLNQVGLYSSDVELVSSRLL